MDKTPIHQKWLKRAKSNLVRAKQPKPEEVYYEDLCYDAQQSVEKLLLKFGLISLIVHIYNTNFYFLFDFNSPARPE